jgi:hypothetical protein
MVRTSSRLIMQWPGNESRMKWAAAIPMGKLRRSCSSDREVLGLVSSVHPDGLNIVA